MSRSTVSRRVSEFVGVALFAAALIWIISLASYEPADPVWFFSSGGAHAAPANFAGRVGAFLAELSFQLFGYASYLVPALMMIIGWNYFWCRTLDAPGTKATGAGLLVACISAFLGLVFGTLEVAGKPFRAGGYAGEFLARAMSEYLNRTGSMIVLLTMIFLAIIISTQFSFGRFFAALIAAVKIGSVRGLDNLKAWREERRREKQRREVIAKHTKKGLVPGGAEAAGADPAAVKPIQAPEMPRPKPRRKAEDDEDEGAPAKAPLFGGLKSFAPPKPPKVTMPAPALPLPDPEPMTKAPAERRKGDYALPPLALLDAPKTERKID